MCCLGQEDGANSGHTASTRTRYTFSTVSVVVLLPLVASGSVVSLGRPLDGVLASDVQIFSKVGWIAHFRKCDNLKVLANEIDIPLLLHRIA